MFTGIILAIGEVESLEHRGSGLRLQIRCPALDLSDTVLGDSLAVNGVCLTVTEMGAARFAADLSGETVARTTLGTLKPGSRVNLEKALRLGDRLGGHLVAGHVDGVGSIIASEVTAAGTRIRVAVPEALTRYIARKGSLCIDGVSLTVNDIAGTGCELMLVPHTLAVTTLGDCEIGRKVNLEIDLVARYLERLLPGNS